MENGYYISCYLSIDKTCNLFDVSLTDRHDQSIALWSFKDGLVKLVAYWEMERYTGIKHFNKAWYSKEQIMGVIDQLLKPYELSSKDIVHFFGTPELDLGVSYDNETEFTYHSLCHLFSAIMLDSDRFYNGNILGMSLDYGSDYETESNEGRKDFVGCVIKRGEMKLFPVQSPAALWAVAAEANHMGEGSLMALATATTCVIPENDVLKREDFGHIYSKKIWGIYQKLIQPIRKMDSTTFRNYATDYDEGFSLRENKISAIMKIIQNFSISMMDEQIEEIMSKYALDGKDTVLAVGGGFCLNCPTNAYLVKKHRFCDFMAAPCVNDSGQSLGIGLYEFYKRNNKIHFSFEDNPFLGGKVYDMNWIKNSTSIKEIKSVTAFCPDVVAKDLINDVIVWYEDYAEIGPRALGHRSLLGNATNPATKDRMNKIKQREVWRPVAPIVAEDEAKKYFYDIKNSPYMLMVYHVREEYKKKLQCILHLDGTARVQTIPKDTVKLQRIYAVLKSVKRYTGYPILCNTSLNDKDEPIIESPQRALEFALDKGIAIVYINGFRIELNQKNNSYSLYTPKIQYKYGLDEIDIRKYNPYQISKENIQEVYRKYRGSYQLTKLEDVEKIVELALHLRNERLQIRECVECI